MRKITDNAVNAFRRGREFKSSNTVVKGGSMFLHGNEIAKMDSHGTVFVTLAGWNTNTTRERLNGIEGVHVNTRKGQAYFNGKEWDGSWIEVTK